jgi:hypothetical protein
VIDSVIQDSYAEPGQLFYSVSGSAAGALYVQGLVAQCVGAASTRLLGRSQHWQHRCPTLRDSQGSNDPNCQWCNGDPVGTAPEKTFLSLQDADFERIVLVRPQTKRLVAC